MSPYDTIIVGFGASGAAAAQRLAAAGKRVLALEAQGRVGGRVMTVPFAQGVVELGAEWIHGTEKSTVYDTATAASIPLVRQELTMEVFRSDGTLDDSKLVNELIDCALEAAGDLPSVPMPLGQWLKSRLELHIARHHPDLLKDQVYLTQFFDFLNLLINNYEASNDWNDVTTASKYTELGGHQHVSWHSRGYETFFDILLNKHDNGPGYPTLEVKLNTEVTHIRVPDLPTDPVVVRTKDGATYEAKNVIVTVSLGVMKASYKTLFTPSLPQDKINAIETLCFGVMDKIIFEFDTEWWPKNATFFGFIWRKEDRDRLEKDEEWISKIFGASTPMGTSNALTLWTSGETGKMVESLSEEAIRKNCLKLLRLFFGSKVTEPKRVIWSKWYLNPYTKGSYSHDGFKAANVPNARPILARPLIDQSGQPRVLFAGEATNFIHFSTVHGAVETGWREAKRLLPNSKI